MHDRTRHGRQPVRRRDLAGLLTLLVAVSAVLAIDAGATELTSPDVTTAADDLALAPPPYAAFGDDHSEALPDDADDPFADSIVAATLRSTTRLDNARERREERAARYAIWDRLADCESGAWSSNAQPIAGSARWDYGLSPRHGAIFEGGLQFHPNTWEQFRSSDMPGHAGNATREQQIAVAERVLDAQGWGAWPKCSRKLGYR